MVPEPHQDQALDENTFSESPGVRRGEEGICHEGRVNQTL